MPQKNFQKASLDGSAEESKSDSVQTNHNGAAGGGGRLWFTDVCAVSINLFTLLQAKKLRRGTNKPDRQGLWCSDHGWFLDFSWHYNRVTPEWWSCGPFEQHWWRSPIISSHPVLHGVKPVVPEGWWWTAAKSLGAVWEDDPTGSIFQQHWQEPWGAPVEERHGDILTRCNQSSQHHPASCVCRCNFDLIREDLAFGRKASQRQVEEKLKHRTVKNMNDYHWKYVEIIKRKHSVEIQVSGFKDFVTGAMCDVKLLLEKMSNSISDQEILQAVQFSMTQSLRTPLLISLSTQRCLSMISIHPQTKTYASLFLDTTAWQTTSPSWQCLSSSMMRRFFLNIW